MSSPLEQKFNDDLLLTDDDRRLAAAIFPNLMHVVDFPQLRKLFADYDLSALRAKKHLQRAGVATIALGVVALVGASTAPLIDASTAPLHDAPPGPVFDSLIVVSAVAGLLSILIGAFGVFSSKTKVTWLENRLMTERLRQFHFQVLVFQIPAILASADTVEKKEQFKRTRESWFSKFRLEYDNHLAGKLKEVLDDDADKNFPLQSGEEYAGKGEVPLLSELFSAYRLLRIKHQIQFANYKLGDGRIDLPRRQVALLGGISLVCILSVFFAHFAISISYVNEMLPFASVKNALAFVHSTPVNILVIWTFIIAFAARTFEEGLQPTREVERYTAYKARMEHLLDHFDDASDATDKMRLMAEAERLVYQEMRGFLVTNDKARFVL